MPILIRIFVSLPCDNFIMVSRKPHTQRKYLSFGFVIFLLTFLMIWSATAFARVMPETLHRYQRIDVLYFVLSHQDANSIDLTILKHSADVNRLFAWRHTGCKIDFNPMFIDVKPDLVSKEFLSQGDYRPELFNELLSYHSKIPSQDVKLVIYIVPPGYLEGIRPMFHHLDDRVFAVIPFNYLSDTFYPSADPHLYHNLIWPILNVYVQSIQCFHQMAGAEKHGLKEWGTFQAVADVLRLFMEMDDDDIHVGEPKVTNDLDSDGIPDDEPAVLLDEIRFGSDPESIDTDKDGMSDFKELTSLLFRATNPAAKDSDHDGIIDGEDSYPHISIQPEIPKFTPSFNDPLDRWYQFSNDLIYRYHTPDIEDQVRSHVYMSWDHDFLYVAATMNIPCLLEFNFDCNDDGWNVGRDNYHLVINPFAKRFEEFEILDRTARDAELTDEDLSSAKDDDPAYFTRHGLLADEKDVILVTQIEENDSENRFIVKFALPRNEQTGLIPSEGEKIGFQLFYRLTVFDQVALMASLHEPDSFFTILLR